MELSEKVMNIYIISANNDSVDLIKDKKSLWFELIDWTNNGESIREKFMTDKSNMNLNLI